MAAYAFFLCIAVIARFWGFYPALVCIVSSSVMLWVIVLNTTDHGRFIQAARLVLFVGASTFVASVTRHKSKEAVAFETRLRALFENAIDAIMFFDDSGRYIDVNPAAADLVGMPREDVLRTRIGDFSPPGSQTDVEKLRRKLIEKGKLQGEWVVHRKDGTIRYTEYRSMANILPGLHCVVSHDITERKEAESSIRQLSHRLLQLQDEERRRIARQLHETTAQTLAAIRLSLARIGRFCDDERAREGLQESVALAEQAISEIRTLSFLLHPPLIDEAGLLPALRWYVRGFEQRSGIATTLDADDAVGRLPSEVETALFRIVQEALTNIQRHSGSAIARIRLTREDEHVKLLVEDEGRGIPGELREDPKALRSSGVGIAGIEQRVHELGGKIEIDSSTGGTKLSVTAPIGGS